MERIWLKNYDRGVPPNIAYPPKTLFGLLEEAAASSPDICALAFLGHRISYSTLTELALRFAGALSRLGIEKGDRVALFLPNCPQYVIAYFASLRLGAVVAPCNPLLVENELLDQLKDCGVKAIVTLDEPEFVRKVMRVNEAIRFASIIVAEIGEYLPFTEEGRTSAVSSASRSNLNLKTGGINLFGDLLNSHRRPPDEHPGSDDLAVVVYTGGTTGIPKGVPLSHRNLVANAMQCESWVPDMKRSEEIFLTVLPMFHTFSLTTCLNLPVLVKSTMVLMPRFDMTAVLKAIDESRPTLFMGVPAIFHAIGQHLRVSRHSLSSVRVCLSAAASLLPETRQVFQDLSGCRLVEGYGLTEASPAVTCNPVYGTNKGIGIPLPDTDCQIVDLEETGRVLPPNATGELCVKGPQVMAGYLGDTPERSKAIVDGWLHTGDVVKMDSDGYFEFIDRKSDIIKVQKTAYLTAYKVFPREVEKILLRHPGVLDATVVGAPDPAQGEKVRAFVVPRSGSNVSERELINFCKETLAEYSIPSEIKFISQLPRDALGKTARRSLR